MPSMKWKGRVVSQMLLILIKRRVNLLFLIVQSKALKAEEVFVTIVKSRNQEKSINRQIMLLIW